MPKTVTENVSDFQKKLDYIGLNLEKTPKFLMDFEPLEFEKSSSYNEDNEHRIFKYISINDIELLVSPTNRLTDIKEKYAKAKPIKEYLNQKNIEEYATFLKMLNMMSIEEIEKIEDRQNSFEKKVPFSVKYDKDYEWQIYYSEKANKYFMLTTSEDYEFNAFFYILKKQIKYNRSRKKIDEKIYVPINYLNYSSDFLSKTEIADLENYLWLFTKNWPNIFEVHDKDDNMNIEIIGTTNVYKNITSGYKVSLKSKEDAVKYYKGLKALFILQTELAFHYHFDAKINTNCELELFYKSEKIDYTNIMDFINVQYKSVSQKMEDDSKNISELESKLENLKQEAALKDLEYVNKQKQIAMYLEYKKTFFGKIKLFLKFKKKNNKEEVTNDVNKENAKVEKKEEEVKNLVTNDKQNYTIEDLILLYAKLEKETAYIKNMKSDIHALELKLKNVNRKIENATKYIEEIDNHKKSIFEFWRFVNKDELLEMEEGTIQDNNEKSSNHKKVFDYELDFTELGIQMDKLQRKLLSKDVQDSVFLIDSNVGDCINIIKSNIDIDIEQLRERLNELKAMAEKKRKIYNMEDFDIFGSISDNTNQVKTLANKKHRETEKDMLNILNISQNSDVEGFKTRLENSEKLVSENINKIKSNFNMPIYVAVSNSQMIDKQGFGVYHIAADAALREAENINSDKINLYQLDITEGMPLIYCTNIIYYNNFNETLPLGMNVTDKVIIDSAKFEFMPKNMITFNICDNLSENEMQDMPVIKTIMLCEYELVLKTDKNSGKTAEEEKKVD